MKDRTPEQLKGQIRNFAYRKNCNRKKFFKCFYLKEFLNVCQNLSMQISLSLKLAVMETSNNRNSEKEIAEWKEIVQDMKEDYNLMRLWDNYCKNNSYAVGILFEDVINVVEKVAEILASV